MPQFTAESLARVLTQVEREVLVEAVELAGIDLLFTSPYRDTLDELAGYLNLVANFRVFGPRLLRESLIQDLEEVTGIDRRNDLIENISGFFGKLVELITQFGGADLLPDAKLIAGQALQQLGIISEDSRISRLRVHEDRALVQAEVLLRRIINL